MSKTIVYYYSKNGSNRYLAERIARELDADIELLVPGLKIFVLLVLFSAFKWSPGLKRLQHNPGEYDTIVLCGPIWVGSVMAPLRIFLRKHKEHIGKLHFATCCGSTDETKDDKYGYEDIFRQLKDLMGDRLIQCKAFPIPLALPEEQRKDDDLIMETRLSDSNFSGELEEKLQAFLGGF